MKSTALSFKACPLVLILLEYVCPQRSICFTGNLKINLTMKSAHNSILQDSEKHSKNQMLQIAKILASSEPV